jgi:hypothetical protein
MPEIGTSGSMSGDGKRSDGLRPPSCRVHPRLYPRVVPCLAQKSVAIGGGADMDDRAAMDDGDVNDPLRKSGAPKCCDAQAIARWRWGQRSQSLRVLYLPFAKSSF